MNTYNAAYNTAVLVDLDDRGRILLTDRDRIELINRMSTHNLTTLAPGQGAITILTTPVGRIIDQLLMLNDGEQAIAITGRGRSERIRGYLQRNIFFNDRVRQSDLSSSTTLLGLYGTQAEVLLEKLGFSVSSLPLFHFIKQDNITLIRVKPLTGHGFWLLGDPEKVEALKSRLMDQGASEADSATYDLLRIEAGYPEVEHELTEDYIPLEAGLWDAVSFHKGCYTGQEIIARMESRGKLAKMLMRLSLDNPVPVGSDLYHDKQKVGTLTSIAAHPTGHHLALGFVKTAVAIEKTLRTEAGAVVQVQGIAGTQPER